MALQVHEFRQIPCLPIPQAEIGILEVKVLIRMVEKAQAPRNRSIDGHKRAVNKVESLTLRVTHTNPAAIAAQLCGVGIQARESCRLEGKLANDCLKPIDLLQAQVAIDHNKQIGWKSGKDLVVAGSK